MPKNARAIKSDLARVRALRDEDIDYSDSPPLDDEFLAQAPVDLAAPPKATVTIRLDEDVLDWFKRAGPGYQTRINKLLRGYVDHQQRTTGVAAARAGHAVHRQKKGSK